MNKSYVLLSLFPVLILLAWQNRDSQVKVISDVEHALPASVEAGVQVPTKEEADLFAISDHISDGQRSNFELDEEWVYWIGQTEPKKWSELNFQKTHRLAMVLSEYQSLADTPLRIMHIHSIGYEGEADDSTTYYTDEIDGLDEKSFRMDLVVSQKIEAQGGQFQLSESDRKAYQLRMIRQTLKRPYDRRAPKIDNRDYFQDIRESDLDIVRTIIEEGSGLSESGLYEKEIDLGGQTYQVQLNLRETKLETTTIEVQVRPVDSLNIQRFALIYEPHSS